MYTVHVHREERIFLHFYFFYCKQLLVYGLMRRLLDTSYTTRTRPGAEWGGGGDTRGTGLTVEGAQVSPELVQTFSLLYSLCLATLYALYKYTYYIIHLLLSLVVHTLKKVSCISLRL